jgi:hypothetical protein
MGKNKCHVKFSLNSTNNLNYNETSPELIAGERQKKKTTTKNPQKINQQTLFWVLTRKRNRGRPKETL